ncbi:MAG: hypothetical protein J6K58_14140 [Lachnospiraceae bacterium]|nr:hypothetical protein [Lachnospiraceae bacterium]
MEVLSIIIDFFGVDAITAAQTFPELIQALCHLFLACFIVLFVVRSVCAVNRDISAFLTKG